MALLSELQPALSMAINSLGRRKTRGVEDLYYLFASGHVCRAVDGFIVLRENDRIDSARLLVRPALEVMLRIRAVLAKPHLIYRVMFAEAIEIDKWFTGVAARHKLPYAPVREHDEWQAFKARCASQFGLDKLKEAPLSAYDAAYEAEILPYYESHYRAYCHYTHGALEAVSGRLDMIIDPEDTRVMVQCAMAALEAMFSLGAECSQMQSFTERALELCNRKPDKLIRAGRSG